MGVGASVVGEAAGVWGLEEPQAPRARAVAATRTEAVTVRGLMFMPPPYGKTRRIDNGPVIIESVDIPTVSG